MLNTKRKIEMSNEEKEEELLLLKLEEEIELLAQKTANYRESLSHHLTSTHSSFLNSQRSILQPNGMVGSSAGTETMPLAITGEPEELKKIQLLKEKIEGNASTALVVLERVKDIMCKMDKLETSNVDIHPAFKWKRAN